MGIPKENLPIWNDKKSPHLSAIYYAGMVWNTSNWKLTLSWYLMYIKYNKIQRDKGDNPFSS